MGQRDKTGMDGLTEIECIIGANRDHLVQVFFWMSGLVRQTGYDTFFLTKTQLEKYAEDEFPKCFLCNSLCTSIQSKNVNICVHKMFLLFANYQAKPGTPGLVIVSATVEDCPSKSLKMEKSTRFIPHTVLVPSKQSQIPFHSIQTLTSNTDL